MGAWGLRTHTPKADQIRSDQSFPQEIDPDHNTVSYISEMVSLSEHELIFIFGLLGNIVSFMVFLAPLPTFYTIYKNKSSQGFQAIPYVVALLSAMLLLYYGLLKTNAMLIVTINSIGCVIELAYLALYLIYAPRKSKISTLLLILVSDVGGFGLTMLITTFIVKGSKRVNTVGWFCAIFNIAVFASPLGIMRTVISTKSVEFMPFTLSFFLTLTATAWFFYGLFDKDYFIMMPNVLGFLFGIAQMILYMMYKDGKKNKQAKSTQENYQMTVVEMHNCNDQRQASEGFHPNQNDNQV